MSAGPSAFARWSSATPGELAAIVVEPVVQGAGGMRFHSPACVALLRELCDEHGLLLVLDEIATGFGRTGALFACEHAGVAPDVMCVGKALTGGYLTLAATLCTRRVADAISAGEGGGLMHGPTFMANPLACAVALASLELLEGADGAAAGASRCRRSSGGCATALRRRVSCRASPTCACSARSASCSSSTQSTWPLRPKRPFRTGVWLRPFRDLIYAMPPYVIDEEDLARVCEAMLAAARAG